MWIKNKKTGIIWEVVNQDMITRLLRNKDYIESRKSTAKKETEKKEA